MTKQASHLLQQGSSRLDERHYFYDSRCMESEEAVDVFFALAQPTRLEAFRLLVANEPDGLPAGDIARLLKVPPNTLSTHLSLLANAGLVTSVRHSRSIVYRASLEQVRSLVVFLLKDCCHGQPQVCQPIIDELNAACGTPKRRR